jgi:menaquinone-dependent protoporphyrinogen oxidase
MSRILIAYSTVDGYTRKICERIRESLERDGHAVTLAELGKSADIDVAPYGKLVIGASIRYGRHREHVYEFIERHRHALEAKPSAFFSVNVVARKAGKDTPEGNPYMKTFRRKARWTPAEQAVFAGRIDYSLYGPVDRNIIRFIMFLTRGPTDSRASIEFTDWTSVDAFARRVSAL